MELCLTLQTDEDAPVKKHKSWRFGILILCFLLLVLPQMSVDRLLGLSTVGSLLPLMGSADSPRLSEESNILSLHSLSIHQAFPLTGPLLSLETEISVPPPPPAPAKRKRMICDTPKQKRMSI